MKPYYQDASVTIYHGDCREILPSIEADILITDPPYGFGAYATDVAQGATIAGLVEGHQIAAVFSYPEDLAALCVDTGLVPVEWITWWPTNAMRGRDPLLQRESEHVAVFGGMPGASRLMVERSESAKRIARAFAGGGKVGPDPDNRRAGDVWRDPKPGSAFTAKRKLHPNEKPISLMLKLVDGVSDPGTVVLDPFMGSGTTLRAAKDLGRKAIGIEIEERYCEIAAQRMGQEVLDLGMAA